MIAEVFVLCAFAALSGGVFVLARRRHEAVMARRRGLLDACLPLFTDRLVRLSPLGYPRLAGTADGLRWDVQLVPDALGVRKLPALWLLVSLPEPMPVAATLHLMLRPTGGEGFSRFRDLPEQVDLPEGFPADAALRTEIKARMPDARVLRPVLSLGQDRLKEIILSPKGLRVTMLVEEADRKNYLILRQTDLGQHPVEADVLRDVMEQLRALRAAVLPDETRKTA